MVQILTILQIAKLQREVGIGRKTAQDECLVTSELQSNRNEV